MNTTKVEREDPLLTLVTDYNYEREVKRNELFKCLRELYEVQSADNYNPLIKE